MPAKAEFRVIIAGGSNFKDYELLKKKVDNILSSINDPITIISGHCMDKERNVIGADKLGEDYAYEKGYDLEMYPANWKRYGKPAGPIRNKKMAHQRIDAVILFWNGFSRGTKSMKEIAESMSIPTRVIRY